MLTVGLRANLMQADVGIAMGGGTDIAIDSRAERLFSSDYISLLLAIS
ncbi:cation transport ATPase [Bradyrhizobium sp. USDA 4518]